MKRQLTDRQQHKEKKMWQGGEELSPQTSSMFPLTISCSNTAAGSGLAAPCPLVVDRQVFRPQNLCCLSLSLTLSTRNSACRTRMGSSCACAVDPGMMLALGKLSHGNVKKKKKKKPRWWEKATSSDIYWTCEVCGWWFGFYKCSVFTYTMLRVRI